jgi:hypothetical protein
MENLQAACVFAGMLLLAKRIWTARDSAQRVLFCGLTLLYLTLLIRELDLREFDLPLLNTFLRGRGRNIWLGLCWLGALVLFLRQARPVWKVFVGWLSQPGGALLLLAGGGWILGGLVDQLKPFASKAQNLLIEELIESNAAITMLACAIWAGIKRNGSAPAAVNSAELDTPEAKQECTR